MFTLVFIKLYTSSGNSGFFIFFTTVYLQAQYEGLIKKLDNLYNFYEY